MISCIGLHYFFFLSIFPLKTERFDCIFNLLPIVKKKKKILILVYWIWWFILKLFFFYAGKWNQVIDDEAMGDGHAVMMMLNIAKGLLKFWYQENLCPIWIITLIDLFMQCQKWSKICDVNMSVFLQKTIILFLHRPIYIWRWNKLF